MIMKNGLKKFLKYSGIFALTTTVMVQAALPAVATTFEVINEHEERELPDNYHNSEDDEIKTLNRDFIVENYKCTNFKAGYQPTNRKFKIKANTEYWIIDKITINDQEYYQIGTKAFKLDLINCYLIPVAELDRYQAEATETFSVIYQDQEHQIPLTAEIKNGNSTQLINLLRKELGVPAGFVCANLDLNGSTIDLTDQETTMEEWRLENNSHLKIEFKESKESDEDLSCRLKDEIKPINDRYLVAQKEIVRILWDNFKVNSENFDVLERDLEIIVNCQKEYQQILTTIDNTVRGDEASYPITLSEKGIRYIATQNAQIVNPMYYLFHIIRGISEKIISYHKHHLNRNELVVINNIFEQQNRIEELLIKYSPSIASSEKFKSKIEKHVNLIKSGLPDLHEKVDQLKKKSPQPKPDLNQTINVLNQSFNFGGIGTYVQGMGKLDLDNIPSNAEYVYVPDDKSFDQQSNFENLTLFGGYISPDDPAQNRIGDCYFLSTLSIIAQKNPALIINAIKVCNWGGKKIAVVRFYNGNKVPVYIAVDYTAGINQAKNNGRNTWVQLFEKAFSVYATKYSHGRIFTESHELQTDLGSQISDNFTNTVTNSSLKSIKGGYQDNVLRILTGKSLDYFSDPFRQIDLILTSANISDYLSENYEVGKYLPKTRLLYQRLMSCFNRGYYIETDQRDENTKDLKIIGGIYVNHSYSIHGFIPNVKTSTGKRLNLIVIRNPWKSRVPSYIKNPATGKYELGPTVGNDGYCIMDFNDLLFRSHRFSIFRVK